MNNNIVDSFSDNETLAYGMLTERYKNAYGENIKAQVEILLSLDGFIDRFNYLCTVLGSNLEAHLPSIMVSGYSAGSEMIVARNFGFQKVYGVEIDKSLYEIAKIRLKQYSDVFPTVYDGLYLPYDDQQFNLVASGHIIEHTQSPMIYLRETFRVLKPGGILYIEFPSRYHHIELHTGLISFEWLPSRLRNLMLRILSSQYSHLKPQIKSRYRDVLFTLKQISRRDIFNMLSHLKVEYREIAHSKPAAGIVRCIIEKK